ncbi:alpha-keto acid decarboxylase family protein [Nocardia sp. NBC_01503]|uniref:alpha-keto acid decarboxylase family protein n=1 Tax=Nocardia sp. NBC_01503 TaxID=2975997 RepID=UPI002E7C14F8|nr:alpha-keto acid decarboxylase family protein [Nocardia sp. NBC_01503]WTL32850.1 alpha-keto acid decarboxylase family protein [Nocardia sp. NBC_01503]
MGYVVGDYLLDRLHELGVTEIFGVPGDFNLQFLDHVVRHPGLRWVGSANELNAGYAADGYARLRGIGAVVTTYGVGELSAVNAIAGSYAEYVPVVHIVGVPAKDIQANHRIIHHTLGDGDFHHFRRIAAEVTCAQADLGAADACQEIDRVLNSVLVHRRPGYLMLATDTARMAVDPPTARLSPPADFSSDGARAAFAVAAREFLAERRVTILADIFVNRIGATDQLRGLLASGDLPYATLAWGKTLVDESTPNFLGVYTGAASPESVRAAVEDAERLVTVGVQYTDSITAGFSHRIDPRRTIDIGPERTVIGGVDAFAPLSLTAALEVLTDLTEEFADPDKTMPTADVIPMVTDANETPLTQATLWPLIAGALDNNNVVVADQGSAFFGLATLRMPTGITFMGQPLWGSIGYALPAALGAGLACPDRRAVLVIGDGAAQLSIQELGTWIRERLTGVIVLVDNDGYAIERAIHGPNAPYNDIAPWRWSELPHAFGGDEDSVLTLRATTVGELRECLEVAAAAQDCLVFLQVVTGRTDYPPLVSDIASAITRANSRS